MASSFLLELRVNVSRVYRVLVLSLVGIPSVFVSVSKILRAESAVDLKLTASALVIVVTT